MAKRKRAETLGVREWKKAVAACLEALTGAGASGLPVADFWAAAEKGAGKEVPGGSHVTVFNGAHAVLDKAKGLVYLEKFAPEELKKKPRQTAAQPEPGFAGLSKAQGEFVLEGDLDVEVITETGGFSGKAKKIVVRFLANLLT